MQKTKTFIFTDVETGGLDDKAHGLTEVAALAFHVEWDAIGTPRVVEEDTMQTYVKPQKWLAFSPGALAMQKTPDGNPMTLEWLEENGREESNVAVDLRMFIDLYVGSQGTRIWAQNADFDFDFLRALFRRVYRLAPVLPERCNWSCSRKTFSLLGALGRHDKTNPSIRYILEHYGVKQEGAHGALADCRSGAIAVMHMLDDLGGVFSD